MAKLFQLLLLIASATAQLDFEDDEPELLWDNTLTRDLSDAIFGENAKTIYIYSDFDSPSDRIFFQRILPWIVDNIGNYLRINYRFRNSARTSGPRMCALRALRSNTYAQAELLRCEANGNPISTCVSQAPIQARSYDRCLSRRVNSHVRLTQSDFDRLISNRTPLVLIGRREIFGNDPVTLLRLMCRSFGGGRPVGCLRVLPIPNLITGVNSVIATNLTNVQNFQPAASNDAFVAESKTVKVAPSDFLYDAASLHQPTIQQLCLQIIFVIFLSSCVR